MMIFYNVKWVNILENKHKNFDYSDVLEAFDKEKIEKRYVTLYEYLESFIERSNYNNQVSIADSVLNQAVIDYFADILRLKDFHHIEAVNHLKIHAYTAYWILRRKPLQIIQDDVKDVELAFVNEKFVCSYLLMFLRGKDTSTIIIESERVAYFEFVKNLEYTLRYRIVTAQMLETILEAYLAGRGFERSAINTDL